MICRCLISALLSIAWPVTSLAQSIYGDAPPGISSVSPTITTPTLTSPVITTSVEASTAGSGAPNVLLTTESGKTLTNEGTTAVNYHTLPAAAAGLNFCFHVIDADGLRVTAAGDDTIRLGHYISGAAGYVQSTDIGSVLCVEALNATRWSGEIKHGGAWQIDGEYVAHYGGMYSRSVQLNKDGSGVDCAILGTGALSIGAVSGGCVIAAGITGAVLLPSHAIIQTTYTTAAYTGGGNQSLRWVNGANSYILSPLVGAAATYGATNASVYMVSIDDAVIGSGTAITDLNACGLQYVTASAFTDPGSAAGTGQITAYWRVVVLP